MTWTEVIDWAFRLIDLANKLAAAEGLAPEAFDAAVAQRTAARQAEVDEQRAAELEAMK